jgi:hypothetical protein
MNALWSMVRDLDEFVECYQLENRNQRKPTWEDKKHPDGRGRMFEYDALVARDRCSLDIFWLKDESLADSPKLPEPRVLAAEIAELKRAPRFSDAAKDVVRARIYEGIHFRTDDTVARSQGRRVAHWAFKHLLRPINH